MRDDPGLAALTHDPDDQGKFRYPWDHPNCESYLIKLSVPAAAA